MELIRLILADDHELVRSGIRVLLQKIPNVQVVAEAGNGDDALELIEEHKPDIALLDISMPGLDGLTLASRVARDFPRVKTIILSMHSEKEYIIRALHAGAKGYLLKGARAPELELAVTAVARGETYLSPGASHHVIDDIIHRAESPPSALEKLTPRQRQVLQFIAEGYSRKQIAQKLRISSKTVDTFRAQLMDELGIHDVAGLVRFAIGIGLVSSERYDSPM